MVHIVPHAIELGISTAGAATLVVSPNTRAADPSPAPPSSPGDGLVETVRNNLLSPKVVRLVRRAGRRLGLEM